MKNKIDKNFLINFENDISSLYEQKKINGLIHLSGNNEIPLIKIFKKLREVIGSFQLGEITIMPY